MLGGFDRRDRLGGPAHPDMRPTRGYCVVFPAAEGDLYSRTLVVSGSQEAFAIDGWHVGYVAVLETLSDGHYGSANMGPLARKRSCSTARLPRSTDCTRRSSMIAEFARRRRCGTRFLLDAGPAHEWVCRSSVLLQRYYIRNRQSRTQSWRCASSRTTMCCDRPGHHLRRDAGPRAATRLLATSRGRGRSDPRAGRTEHTSVTAAFVCASLPVTARVSTNARRCSVPDILIVPSSETGRVTGTIGLRGSQMYETPLCGQAQPRLSCPRPSRYPLYRRSS